ncbi:unnamed protein product [Paramecium sonneborni]|uniref:Uncharacterized protein n=1 Tax=Paramecium sonneborni TaxID=65129 RepID=A0A8S1M714_9CILI|nr:unnamed protein product [Paramecium sonneborni]
MQDQFDLSPNLSQQMNRIQFEIKKKQLSQQEQLDANSKKIEELEKIVFQLQNENEKKQKEIDDLVNVQKKFAKDILQLWKSINAVGKTKSFDSQMNSQLLFKSDSYTLIQKELESQAKQAIQKEISDRFSQIQDSLIKRSEFENSIRKIQEQIEKFKLQLIPEPENYIKKRNSLQENYNMQFNFQMNQNDLKIQTLQNQSDRNEQIFILDTYIEQKQI